MALLLGNARKNLSADALFRLLRSRFDSLSDPRSGEVEIPLGDTLMSAFAMFSLKDPSLLAFDHRRRDPNDNFRTIYGINRVPSDSQMRAILDPVDPADLRPGFRDLFRPLQRGKVLERFIYLDDHYLLSLDGTTYFSSPKIHCSSCLVKHHRNGGVTYSHQLLGPPWSIPTSRKSFRWHPSRSSSRTARPRMTASGMPPAAGSNSFARIIPICRSSSSKTPSAPTPRTCATCARPARTTSSASSLATTPSCSSTSRSPMRPARCTSLPWTIRRRVCCIIFDSAMAAPLNESNPDELVNVLEYWEIHPKGKVQHFSWITDFLLTRDNVWDIMRGGRARWKIENETFNTLKNQGYHLEHNYGHGEQNLSVVLALLMMLAFLVDQVQQLCCPLFQAAWHKMKTKCHLWEELRHHFRLLVFDSMAELLMALVRGIAPQKPVFENSS